ncbi:hypothetical protein PHLGIDRAFT_372306 [Phlebiopsis gigantea 11061_1 CR5-6]|uniref:DUF5745 domain-containing protein n=1 Tax=Phlebiopsis gigantea (strain 11061_1 CR5-6) TaxID=745531 RepID=A0A0C3PNY5_PHLG1|nr:hypothetical protein PHLGIDRAFT_372306 [Phlebiopsis gigantea 11061_1 CR5-6]
MDRQDSTTTLINELMCNLGLPLSIEATSELTSSLILAILESTLRRRLPIFQSLREARDLSSRSQLTAQVLRYLENDLVQQNIGLEDIESVKLARGEEAETEFIGKLLCWLGELKGYLPDGNMSCPVWRPQVPENVEPTASTEAPIWTSSPTHSSFTAQKSMSSALFASTSMPAAESDTTVLSSLPETPPQRPTHLPELTLFEAPFNVNDLSEITTPTRPRSHTAQCIHEIGHTTRTLPAHSVQDDPDETMTSTPVRTEGWIAPVDIEEELHSFESAHPPQKLGTPRRPPYRGQPSSSGAALLPRTPQRVVTRHNSPSQHTLALLNERAKLMGELAQVKTRAYATR